MTNLIFALFVSSTNSEKYNNIQLNIYLTISELLLRIFHFIYVHIFLLYLSTLSHIIGIIIYIFFY